MTAVSFFLMWNFIAIPVDFSLDDFGGEGDDFHEVFRAQFASDAAPFGHCATQAPKGRYSIRIQATDKSGAIGKDTLYLIVK